VGFGIIGLGAYYLADNADRIVYVQFQSEDRRYFSQVRARYGDYNYRERIYGFGGEGWRYYWIQEQNVICVFVRNDGFAQTFIWNRAETDSQAVALGLLTAAQLAMFSQYSADMPPELVVDYLNIVIWSQTEWK
jgi:hypothetical protein